jgi:hypothetical protein
MSNVTIKGVFQGVYPIQPVNADFSKRLMCVNTGEAFNNLIVMELHKTVSNDRLNLMNGFNKGDEVEVTANIVCRKSVKNGVTAWFTTLIAWSVRTAQTANDFNEPEPIAVVVPTHPITGEIPKHPITGDDLPF